MSNDVDLRERSIPMASLQVRLTNSTVRLEHFPGLEQRGLALQLQLGKLVYRGQAGQVGAQEPFCCESRFATAAWIQRF